MDILIAKLNLQFDQQQKKKPNTETYTNKSTETKYKNGIARDRLGYV